MLNKKKPVTIITGYLGSGKTTVLNELIKSYGADGLAVIVNDMGSVNVDASILKNSSVLEADTKMIELTNGCICCTLQDAFMTQIEKLSQNKKIERIIVEASGISNPAAIAEGFMAYTDINRKCKFYLDSIVTVVDGDRIYAEFIDRLEDEIKKEDVDKENCQGEAEDDPDIINLVMDQIEFCNIVLLNKCDLLSYAVKTKVKKIIRTLQKEATIIECIYGKVNPDRIFTNKKFDYEKVLNSSRIQESLAREHAANGEVDEYGISSFVFEDNRPLDYEKFISFVMDEYPKELIRAKGYVWFFDDDIHVQLFEQSGRNAAVSEVSNWVAAFSEEEKKKVFEAYPDVLEDWDEVYGDRMNQIVFIGQNYDKEYIMRKLNECIVTDKFVPTLVSEIS